MVDPTDLLVHRPGQFDPIARVALGQVLLKAFALTGGEVLKSLSSWRWIR